MYRRLELLTRVSEILASSLDYEATLRQVAWLAVPELADWCAVHLVDTDGSVRVMVAYADQSQATLRIDLKYSPDGEPVIHGIERISRPGRRVYRNKQEIPRVLGGLGLAIVSTSKGVLAGHEAAKNGIGGEVLCQVW